MCDPSTRIVIDILLKELESYILEIVRGGLLSVHLSETGN